MTDSTGQLANPGGTLFDAIMLPGERWSARTLMPLLGYGKWENFQSAIERAVVTAANSGVPEAISRHQEVVPQGGPARVDYSLSRFGAYLVAMNGDPRKPEVAAAQAYFAIRTREAETRPPFDPAQLSRADILKMALAAEEENAVLAATLESAAPAIAYHERHIAENDDVVTVKTWGTQFGLTEPKAYALLVQKGIVYKLSLGERWSRSKGCKVTEYEYRPRAGRITFEWFDLRPQHNAPRHHNGQVRQTLYVKQFFADRLADKCDLTRQLHIDGDAA